ncbi:MAG: putative ABC transporter permease [Clostridiales bacterium]|nr:putative ABC transporter permease [Clostridiales bacterium]
MVYSGYELIWLFFIYSFLGWVLETVIAALKKKQMTNRGVINAPLCISYGITMALITVIGQELTPFWLFCGATVIATVVEWIAGHFIEIAYHERWWDYSKVKWNLDGYICLPVSLAWGALGTVCMLWGNELIIDLFRLMPDFIDRLVVWICIVASLLDILATLILIYGKSRYASRWREIDNWFTSLSRRLGRSLYDHVNHRIEKAYPQKKKVFVAAKDPTVFAAGCSPYKLVWMFIIGAVLGDVFEIFFCRATQGIWMSRSSLVWGQFSIVWGFALAAATALLHRCLDRSDSFLFITGTVLGGVYEYLCSVLSEIVFGTVFWDYSKLPFNLGGRINLLYCFFWGFAAVLWIRVLYPPLSSWIEKFPKRPGKFLTWCLIVFFLCDGIVSAAALVRSDERANGIEATESWQQLMDSWYDDETLAQIYPNAIRVE